MFIKNCIQFIKKNGIKKFSQNSYLEILKKFFCIKEIFLFKGNNVSYSQYCEDLFIIRQLNYKQNIQYIDIGANHPHKHTNTKKIYLEYNGSGINIDANPELIQAFNKERKKDKNLNIGIGKSGILPFYISSKDTLSSFSSDVKEKLDIVKTINIKVIELKSLFKEYNIEKKIDLLSIDVEGWNLEVLKSNDWGMFRPKLICIENDEDGNKEISNYLKGKKYKKIGYNGLNSFFIKN